jgi:O-antigen/teichoic acid export membrane protein
MVGAAAGANVFLNILLIPRYAMIGAAVATAISYGTQVLLTYVVASRMYYVPFELKRIGIALLCASSIYGLSTLIQPERLLLRILLGLLWLGLFPVTLFLLRFFGEDEMRGAKRLFFIIVGLVGLGRREVS